MSINLVTIKETAIAEIVAATGSEQLIDKATRRNFVGLYDENTNWYIPLRANLGRKKPQGAVFDTPFKTTNPHFKRPGLDFQKAIYLEKDGVLPIRNTLPKEQSEFLEAHQADVKRAFEQYILKVANHEMSDNQYFMSTPSLFPEGIEKIRQQVEQIVEPVKQTEEPIILEIETYEKFTVEYHPVFDSNVASVNVATSEGDIAFVKDEDGELIVAASHQVDNLSNDDKRSMKEIAEFKFKHPEKSMQEFSIMKLQNESKEQALHQADDGTKMFEFQFYDELIPGSYDADKKTVKINFTARDTINYQHHQFVAEVDVLSPINAKNKIKLSTARFFENNQDISKKLGVLDWTESINNFKITLPQNKEELKKEIEQAITTKISDARASDSLVEVAKISGEIDTLEGHLDEVSAQPITTSDELVQPFSLQELIAQKDLKGIEEHIKSGIGEYLDSETFKNYLDFARQFRQYSYRNKILIKGQNPTASLVAGYRSWQEKGRQVQRGQKALKIFVPNLAAKKDKDGNYSRDKEGNIIKEVKGFYLASVYDVSQTEGEPIPKPIYELEENINNPRKFDWYIKAITELSPVPIQFSEIEGTAKGFFVPAEKQITIRPGMSQSQTIKTMLHEVTHSILHDNDVPVFGSSEYARQEIEAESVAYMVANSLGIETQDYSFGYLASWTDLGLSLENLERSLDLICNQAQKMMGELDNILKQTPIEEQTQEVKPEQKQSNPRPKSSIKMHM
ncbi:ArdC-like ssDNA-binding domain-containing protein [Lactococcus lactis]|uniref:ArdC-like ssDNA-binding domain-containing protein n=1 Tax=Lactococcus lactis TaxID=1358 RepID=UPI001913DFB6|nr:ArdC-like ssDNA-binding domain-containing protein [Lactococcus lactis]WDA67589.1 ArdC-like ssDNA-binding domain-containing protein [Lactococcus lactis]